MKILDEKSIYTLFKIVNLSLSQTLEKEYLIKNIDLLIKNIKNSSLNIKIKKQVLSQENEKIINAFLLNIEWYKEHFKDFTFVNLNVQKPLPNSKIDLILLELKYENVDFIIKTSQLNLELFCYIYLEKQIIFKDRIFRIEDLNRIFYFVRSF